MHTTKKKTVYQRGFKRFFDICFSLAALFLLSPVFLVVFFCSKIALGGRVIFCQYRPGKDGKIFKMYKFRSMSDEVDEKGNLLPDEKRITRYGKFLRKTSIDELPQLVNILKGEMSLIGPRPRMIKDVIFFDESARPIFDVRPGLTGKSQVSGGRCEASWQQIFDTELSYVQNITFFGDVKIFFQTFGAIFKGSAGGANDSKREYYYCDHLLKSGKISKKQYNFALAQVQKLTATGSNVWQDAHFYINSQPRLSKKQASNTGKKAAKTQNAAKASKIVQPRQTSVACDGELLQEFAFESTLENSLLVEATASGAENA